MGQEEYLMVMLFHFLTKQLLLSDFAVSKANLSVSCFHSTTQVFVPTILSKVRCLSGLWILSGLWVFFFLRNSEVIYMAF